MCRQGQNPGAPNDRQVEKGEDRGSLFGEVHPEFRLRVLQVEGDSNIVKQYDVHKGGNPKNKEEI